MQDLYWDVVKHHQRCMNLAICIGCENPLKHGGVLCSMCQIFRYCSPSCLEKDRPRHSFVCYTIVIGKEEGIVFPEHLKDVLFGVSHRAKLLDSEGDFISPAVIQDAYLVRGSNSFSRVISNLQDDIRRLVEIDECKIQNPDQTYVNASKNIKITASGNIKSAGAPEVFKERTSFKKGESNFCLLNPLSTLENGDFGKCDNARTQIFDQKNGKETRLKDSQTSPKKCQSQPILGNAEICVDSNEHKDDCEEGQSINSESTGFGIIKSSQEGNSSPFDSQSNKKIAKNSEAKEKDEFGLDWWVKKKEKTPKKSVQANISRQSESNNKSKNRNNAHGRSAIHNASSSLMEDVPTGNCSSAAAHISGGNSGSSQVKRRLESEFGSGWWQNNVPGNSKTATSSSAKYIDSSNPMSGELISENKKQQDGGVRNANSNNVLTNSPSSIGNLNSDINSSNSIHNNRVPGNNSTSNCTSTNSTVISSTISNSSVGTHISTINNNTPKTDPNHTGHCDKKITLNSSASSNIIPSSSIHNNRASSNSIPNYKVTHSQTDRQSEGRDFGSGWWKPVKGKKGKANPSRPNSGHVPAKEHTQMNVIRPDPINSCHDIVSYKTFILPEQILRFMKVACRIDSSLIKNEAAHGRVLVMALFIVPGLWRASLGGSRVSLLVEIVSRYPSDMLGIIISDKFGHTAPVILNTTESSIYKIPETNGQLSVPMSRCLKPGNFIVLGAVNWSQLPNGDLGIVIMDMKDVGFIFYDLLDV